MNKATGKKTIVIMPAYNVANVLEKTVAGIPKEWVDEIIVINDGSSDATPEIARRLGLSLVSHARSHGYGAVQKTGYKQALKHGAEYVVMVHGDNQYDPTLVPEFIKKLHEDGFDVVTGSRMILGDVLRNGMPLWKYIPNRFLTWLENTIFQTRISDYHNGYRAFTADFLQQIPLDLLSDKFDFDTDILIQAAIRRAKIAEIPHTTRYEDENSQMSFGKAVRYGLMILVTVVHYMVHRSGIWRQRAFQIKTITVG
jgi:glycosyltransferase involved in cell wall biosynthesis